MPPEPVNKLAFFKFKNKAGITHLWRVYTLRILMNDLHADAFGGKRAMCAAYQEIHPLKKLN